MLIKVEPDNSTPVYAQIADQVRRAIATGIIRPGEPLPSLRETAIDLRINPQTVIKAYRQLEQEGLIETRHGLGSFVSAGALAPASASRAKTLERLVDRLLVDAHSLGATKPEIAETFAQRLRLAGDDLGAIQEDVNG